MRDQDWRGQPLGKVVCRIGRHAMQANERGHVRLPDGSRCCRSCWDRQTVEVQAAYSTGQPVSDVPDPDRVGWRKLVSGTQGDPW